MMRFMTPQGIVEKLCNLSVTVATPIAFAVTTPTRPVKVDRANTSAIVDQDWEVYGRDVRLQTTKQNTVSDNCPVSDCKRPSPILC